MKPDIDFSSCHRTFNTHDVDQKREYAKMCCETFCIGGLACAILHQDVFLVPRLSGVFRSAKEGSSTILPVTLV